MRRALPPLESLRVLAACVRHASFTGAARELGITPAAVSLRMRDLEAELGIALFHRHGPRLRTSAEAEALGAKVDEALALLHGAIDACRTAKPSVRVTCAPTFAARWLVPRLGGFQSREDAAPIVLDTSARLLAPHEFDVAIRSGRGPWPDCSAIPLLVEQGTPMLSPRLVAGGTSLSPDRLLELPLIPDPRWPAWFERAGLPDARPRFAATRFPTYELEAQAAMQGVGVALLSPILFGDLCASGALVAPFETVVDGPESYWALWQKGRPTPPFVQWLRDQLAPA